MLAQTTSALYLEGEGEEILWLCGDGMPLHRRCVVTGRRLPSLPKGATFQVREQSLYLGDRTGLRLDGATTWEPLAVTADLVLPIEAAVSGLLGLYRHVCALPNRKGLGKLTPCFAAIAFGDEPRLPPENEPLLGRALASVVAVAEGCLQSDSVRIAGAAENLIGLGPGLTPSGDDFVGGVAFAAHHLGRAYPARCQWDGRPIIELVSDAHRHTNSVSHAILTDLAAGHGPEPLHSLLVSLLMPRREESPLRQLYRLLSIGHTSGWDLLAGLLAGILMLVGTCPSR